MSDVDLWHSQDGDGLWDWNLATNRIHFSPRWLSLIGCDEHEVQHTPQVWLRRIHPEDRDLVVKKIEEARAHGLEFEFHHRLRHQDGTYRWMVCSGQVFRNETGQAVRLIGAHADVTVAKVTDPETGLPNRLLLLDRLSRSIEKGRRHRDFLYAVLAIELSQPTDLASELDSAIFATVARRLETCLRTRDQHLKNDLVACVGRDTFAVLLEGLDNVSDALAIGERIVEALRPPVAFGGRHIFLSTSIGIAVSETGYTGGDEMLRDADTAAHRARALGGSHCEVFDTALVKSAHALRTLQGDLIGALNRREFRLVYQPIVSLASQRIEGFEALVRWHHPARGVIAPVDFIPLAERTGVIVALGAWILREACRQLKCWQVASPNLWMSVNLSVAQLKHPALLQEISDAVREAAINPGTVALELTEGMVMDDPVAVKTLLMRVRAMGIRVSMDDFGTGYSSLAGLRDLPVDTLKIDRSFIRGIEHDTEKVTIARTLTTMARELGLTVIAEGIENHAQVLVLQGLHCDAVQGFLFAEPLHPDAATRRLDSGVAITVESEPRTVSSGRWVTIAAAALTLVTGGFAARFISHQPHRMASTSPSFPERTVRHAAPPETATTAETAAPPAGSAVPSIQLESTQSPEERRDRPSRDPVQLTAHSRPAVSVNVEHLHRFGSCRGQLSVSDAGVVFVPDEKTSADAFSYAHGDFLASTTSNTFVVKSHTKTYRFRPLTSVNSDAASQLHSLTERTAISR